MGRHVYFLFSYFFIFKEKNMNIKEFEVGDIITRAAPAKESASRIGRGGKDMTRYYTELYIGEELIFQGFDEKSKTIFLIDKYGKLIKESFVIYEYNEGWEKWPEDLFKKGKKVAEVRKAELKKERKREEKK